MRILKQIVTLATVMLVTSTSRAQSATSDIWGILDDGREVKIFTLRNQQGTQVKVAEYGALLVSIEVADQDGNSGNITLSYQSLDEALAGGVYGSIVGRFANRIDTGGFTIDGERFDLETVNPKTQVHIHGGLTGFQRQIWQGKCSADNTKSAAEFHLMSPDGHEGYPGKTEISVTYRLSNENALTIEYHGITDKPTHLNLTNHVYFNLNGEGEVLDHQLELTSEQFLEFDARKIPTGNLLSVENTPFDFRSEKSIGKSISQVDGGGYDHCFVIPPSNNGTAMVSFARLTSPRSGRTLAIETTMPGVQIYTANHFKNKPFPKWGGICFETQYYPDTPNQKSFPSSLLRPGQTYHHTTKFHFGTLAATIPSKTGE
tara:strand:+ start:1888 stop:3009 length:1122 start_codon:yes stop_codon:yes gene_type:complete